MIRNVFHVVNVERIAVRRAGAGRTAGIRRSRIGAGAAAAAGQLNFVADVLRQLVGVAGQLVRGPGLVLSQSVASGRTAKTALDLGGACGAAALIAGVGTAGAGIGAAGICALVRRTTLARTRTRALVSGTRAAARARRALSERHCRGQQQGQHHKHRFFHASSSETNTPRGVMSTRLECEVQGIR